MIIAALIIMAKTWNSHVFFNRRMDKQIEVHLYDKILLSIRNMGEYYIMLSGKQMDTRVHIEQFYFYEILDLAKLIYGYRHKKVR